MSAPDTALTLEQRVAVTLPQLMVLAQTGQRLRLPPQTARASASGGYLSRVKGQGMVFDETRVYQPGDDVRHIDWRVTARTDKPHSKLFREERERPVFMVVDYRASMAFATRGVFKSVLAAQIAALLAGSALQQGDRIGGEVFSDSGYQAFKPRSGKAALMPLLNGLVQPVYHAATGNPLEHALRRVRQHAHPGSQLLLISDFSGYNAQVEQLLVALSRHCQLRLIQIADPLEMQLPPRGQFWFSNGSRQRLIDCADGERRHHYQQRFLDQQTVLQQLCRRYGMGYLFCTTSQSPQSLLFKGVAFNQRLSRQGR